MKGVYLKLCRQNWVYFLYANQMGNLSGYTLV